MSMAATSPETQSHSAGRSTWRRRRRRKAFSEINVTPFVDVMLVLLVIFIVTAPSIVKEGVEVKLPDARGTPGGGVAPTVFTITIDSNGKVYVTGKTIEPSEIEIELPASLKGHENETVSLKADANARQGTMVRVYAVLRQAGITKINFPVAGKN